MGTKAKAGGGDQGRGWGPRLRQGVETKAKAGGGDQG